MLLRLVFSTRCAGWSLGKQAVCTVCTRPASSNSNEYQEYFLGVKAAGA